MRELPLSWKTGWEDSETNKLRTIGGEEATDLEFSPLSESSGVKSRLKEC